IDGGEISPAVKDRHPGGIDAVLELVGSSTVRDSLKMLKKDGRLCMAGFLGGGGPIEGFNPLMDLPSGVDFNFFGSAFVLGDKEFPLDKIPMQAIIAKAATGKYKAKPARVFQFEQIVEAHRLMESGKAKGKIVVEV
ncbi:MAG TPA: zinc-binding dehydrogenase, partial [Gammaproteobacteria bacterium]|nr:zinc-binding dehydrogenase [Gammaproteobacteria bacterium]